MNDKSSTARTGVRRLRADAPAKINLSLEVLGGRGDGFHEIRSVAIGVELRDEIVIAQSTRGCTLECNVPHLRGSGNLAARAARRLAHECGIAPDVRIQLTKRIPEGGGMGGGSSDAATTLRLCNALWNTGMSEPQLAALGAQLGSDVPLFFHLPSAMMTGRGERVTPVALRWQGWALLVFCGGVVPTGDVYRAWRPDDRNARPCGDAEQLSRAETADALAPLLGNQLEPAVFRVAPHVQTLFDELTKWEVGRVCVSGAGSTLFVLFDDPDSARDVARRVVAREISTGARVVRAPSSLPPPPDVQELQHGDFGRTDQDAGEPQRSTQSLLHHHV